jgi:hypothetical protein
MIDALAQIGGAVAEGALAEALQRTADPREIALLAQDLARLNPGIYEPQALDAARQTLAMAAAGNLPNRDVAPLFEVLQKYGGAGALADLQGSVSQWTYYSMMALAQLPDGAGVSTLIQFASGPAGSSTKTAALQSLVQAAPQFPEAKAALLDLARQGGLSAYEWALLVPSLAGNQMVYQNSVFENVLGAVNPADLRKTKVSAGNQSFLTAPLNALTPDQIQQQQALLDELLAAATSPAATQALQQAKATLTRRLAEVASTGQ